ncbi:ComF family protein [Alicyclobacillus cycloheptanicus]|uniref:ComF family protein n=1 Tax=Alicyclobacillus cycloheptanicus TaxID=1457 RepID=A0ABT9XLB1_9BACL|nr:ComF family protein [Alicyclobacillus cycloheptanicus]WDL99825.1 ComF family protein [Alicyclobacillus cycloheptanicus]
MNVVFPVRTQVCLLCDRPMQPVALMSGSRPPGAGEDSAPPERVCLFCIQDTRYAMGDAKPRSISVSGRQLPVYPAMPYEGLARTAIRKWKYDGVLALTPWFGDQIASVVRRIAARYPVDAMTPVPTSVDRWRKRGYHHVGLLAQDVARKSGVAVLDALVRHQDMGRGFTQSQTAKSAAERRRSLVGAYEARAGMAVAGRRILLVDDVVTTGATMECCARALLAAGAADVICAAISVVERGRA